MATATDPVVRRQTKRDAINRAKRIAVPPVYPIPRERVEKSASVVPTVVVETIVAQ